MLECEQSIHAFAYTKPFKEQRWYWFLINFESSAINWPSHILDAKTKVHNEGQSKTEISAAEAAAKNQFWSKVLATDEPLMHNYKGFLWNPFSLMKIWQIIKEQDQWKLASS